MSAAVVLVHGAWHRPEPTWTSVIERLRQCGIDAVAVALPSADPVGAERPGLSEDAATVRTVLDDLGQPVVLCGHSYGGMVISTAGDHPLARRLVYLAAFCLNEGETIIDVAVKPPLPPIMDAIIEDDTGLLTIDGAQAVHVFYADVPAALAKAATAALVASSAAIFATPQPPPAWTRLPSLYVACERDQAVPFALQLEMARRCTARHTLDASHSPFLSLPDDVADLLAAEASSAAGH